MNEWNIQSRAHTCQACGKHFADKQVYHTALFDTRREVQRIDVCESCWKSDYAENASSRQGYISQWQGIYEAPPAAPPEAIKKENAESLLRKIIELNAPQHAAASYILAVMLERKRILKVKEQFKRDGRRIFVYEHPKTGDIFTIPDPDLQLNQLEQVQRDVASLLEHGLPGGQPDAPPASTSTSTSPSTSTSDPVQGSAEDGTVGDAGGVKSGPEFQAAAEPVGEVAGR